MKLSLSTRIAERFGDKRQATMSLEALAAVAETCGYHALCLRASQIGVDDPRQSARDAARLLDAHRLGVSMVTGDFAIPENTDDAPAALRRIGPYLDLAEDLDCDLLRVAMKTADDVAWARTAADEARERGLRLAHQCHTRSLFEVVDESLEVLRAVGRPNFGLIYEPANLELCGQPYTGATVQRLAPWVFNVYLQNQHVHERGADAVRTWTRGTVRFDQLPVDAGWGIDFPRILDELAAVGYDGTVTVHQAAADLGGAAAAAAGAARYLRRLGPFDERRPP